MRCILSLPLLVAACLLVGSADAQIVVTFGEKGADFPPGVFTDGMKYHVSDFKGKALALFFFDPNNPNLAQNLPEKIAVVNAFRGKPISFLGVAVNGSPAQAAAVQQVTGNSMPIFMDNLGLMDARYNTKISMQNAWQFRVLDADGKMAGLEFSKAGVEKVVPTVSGTIFQGIEIKPNFAQVTNPFEAGQFAAGMKGIPAFRKTLTKKADLATLDKIQEVVKKEVAKWKSEADQAANSAPLTAYDLYQRVAAAMPSDEMGKSSLAAAKKLAEEKSVKAELTARVAYQKVVAKMIVAAPNEKATIAAAFFDVGKKYRDTTIGLKATALADEMGYEPPMAKKK